jgi:hypothetical protein
VTVIKLIMSITKPDVLRATMFAIMLCFATNCGKESDPYEGNAEARPFTQNLPSVDRLELMALERVGDLWTGEIKASKIIEGNEAQKVASLWRNQLYLPDSPICHNPAYAIRFFSREKLIAYASLCWDCDNIEFLDPRVKGYQGFAGKSDTGQRLLDEFTNAFPETKRNSGSK